MKKKLGLYLTLSLTFFISSAHAVENQISYCDKALSGTRTFYQVVHSQNWKDGKINRNNVYGGAFSRESKSEYGGFKANTWTKS